MSPRGRRVSIRRIAVATSGGTRLVEDVRISDGDNQSITTFTVSLSKKKRLGRFIRGQGCFAKLCGGLATARRCTDHVRVREARRPIVTGDAHAFTTVSYRQQASGHAAIESFALRGMHRGHDVPRDAGSRSVASRSPCPRGRRLSIRRIAVTMSRGPSHRGHDVGSRSITSRSPCPRGHRVSLRRIAVTTSPGTPPIYVESVLIRTVTTQSITTFTVSPQ
jgi:hypothetical protein